MKSASRWAAHPEPVRLYCNNYIFIRKKHFIPVLRLSTGEAPVETLQVILFNIWCWWWKRKKVFLNDKLTNIMVRLLVHEVHSFSLQVLKVHSVVLVQDIFFMPKNKLIKLFSFSWLNKQTTQLQTVLLCVYVADPATFLARTLFSSENSLFIHLWGKINLYFCIIL